MLVVTHGLLTALHLPTITLSVSVIAILKLLTSVSTSVSSASSKISGKEIGSSNHGGKTCHCRCVNLWTGSTPNVEFFASFLYSNILVMKHRCQNLAVDPTASNV